MVQPYQPPWIIPPDQLSRSTQPRKELPQVDSRRENARRYGRLAGKIAKAGGMALVGGAGLALGAPFGYHQAGTHAFQHAIAEVIQIIEDPWG